MSRDMITAQLVDELTTVTTQLAPLSSPDLIDELNLHIYGKADDLAATLTVGDEPDRVALARTLLTVLWHDSPPVTWWRTPLGTACAAAMTLTDDATPMSRADTRDLLHVTKGTVDKLVALRRLHAHPDGGLTRTSVLRYWLRRRPYARRRLPDTS